VKSISYSKFADRFLTYTHRGKYILEPGRVGIPAVRVVVVWTLSIVVSARLTEMTLFYGKTVDASYSTFLVSFENQTQVCNLGYGFRLYGKDDPLIQGYCPRLVTNSTNLVQLIVKELQHSINW